MKLLFVAVCRQRHAAQADSGRSETDLDQQGVVRANLRSYAVADASVR